MDIEENLNFKEQFKAIGLSLAKKAKKEVKEFRINGDLFIKELNGEFVDNVKEELFNSTANFIRDYENNLNTQISTNISKLNESILSKKNALFEDFSINLLEVINKKIENNYSGYKDYLLEILSNRIGIFDSEIFIQSNERDEKVFSEISQKFGNKKIFLTPSFSSTIGGLILTNEKNTIIVDDTFENLIESKKEEILKNFGSVFPTYHDKRKTATDLMKEKNINNLLEIPNELNDFIKKNEVHTGKK